MLFKRMKKVNLFSNIAAMALLIVVSIIVNGSTDYKDIFSMILIYSISALALNIVCGCLGEFVLGHGGFLLVGYTAAVLIGTYISKMFDQQYYWENVYFIQGSQLHFLGYVLIFVDVLIAALITAGIGFLVGLFALGRLKGDYLAIVTLGVGLVFVNIAKAFQVFSGPDGSGIGIKSVLGGSPLVYAIFLIMTIFLILTFMKSRFGRNILACRDDNIAAEACGVPVKKTKLIAFTFSTFIAGIAGGLLAHFMTYEPNAFGQDMSILFLIIIVLGGLGSLTGSIIASIVIVLYEQWFCLLEWVPEFFKSNPKIIYGIILVLIMLFRSKGILGNAEFTWDWFYSKLKKIKNKIFKKKAPKEVE